MFQNITISNKSTTLSEKELFADVFNTRFFRYSVTGKKQGNDHYALTLRNVLDYCDEYGHLDDISSLLVKQISHANQPEIELMCLIDALEGMVSEYKFALAVFRDFKADRQIEQTEEEIDVDADQRFKTKATYYCEIAESNERQLMAIIKECEEHSDGELA